MIYCILILNVILGHSKNYLPCIRWKSVWVIIVYRQFRNFSALSWREQVNYQWDDDEVRFVLDEHAKLDFHSASSLKQRSSGRHVVPRVHIIMIPSRPVFALSLLDAACWAEKQHISLRYRCSSWWKSNTTNQ